jgi:hypothetical protein
MFPEKKSMKLQEIYLAEILRRQRLLKPKSFKVESKKGKN